MKSTKHPVIPVHNLTGNYFMVTVVLFCFFYPQVYAQPCFQFNPKSISAIMQYPIYLSNFNKDTVFCVIPRLDSCARLYPFVRSGSEWKSYYANGMVKEIVKFKRYQTFSIQLNTEKPKTKSFTQMQMTGYYSCFYPNGDLAYRIFYTNYRKDKAYSSHKSKGRSRVQSPDGIWMDFQQTVPGF